MTPTTRGTIIAVCCAVSFGLYPASVRAVYADGGNPSLVIIVTTWARAALLVGFCLIRRTPLYTTAQSRKLAVSGTIFQALSIIGVIGALKYLPGPLVLIILFTHTLMLLFFTAWRGETQLNRWTIGSTISALFGLCLVLDIWHVQPVGYLVGMALAFMAALATASRLYAFGKQTQTRNPAVVGAETFFGAAVVLSFTALFQSPHLPAHNASYFYLALAAGAQAVATFGMFYSIALIGAFRWSLLLKLDPVFTTLFSFLILGEVLKPLQYVGMAVVLGSLAAYQVTSHRKTR